VRAEGEAGKRGGGAPERRGVLDGVYSSAGSDSAPALHSPDGVTCARPPGPLQAARCRRGGDRRAARAAHLLATVLGCHVTLCCAVRL